MLIGPIRLLVVVPALRMMFLGSEDEPAGDVRRLAPAE